MRGLWSDDTFLLPLTSKCWEHTTKILALCISHARAVREHFTGEGLPFHSTWCALVCTRVDAGRIGQILFDDALECIWPRLRELGVDMTPFGQTMNAFSDSIEKEGAAIQSVLVDLLSKELDTTMEGITQLPKQYRWTKKPAPTSPSQWVEACLSQLETAVHSAKGRGLQEADNTGKDALQKAADKLIVKAVQVLDTVDATSSSLSRLKRREGAPAEGETDEDKIRMQMGLDVRAVYERIRGGEGVALENGAVSTVEAMEKLMLRLQGSSRQPSA